MNRLSHMSKILMRRRLRAGTALLQYLLQKGSVMRDRLSDINNDLISGISSRIEVTFQATDAMLAEVAQYLG